MQSTVDRHSKNKLSIWNKVN